jgi:hypothetical protein
LGVWRYFSEDGFLTVQKGKFWSVINNEGKNHIPFQYDEVIPGWEGKIFVRKNDKWGLLDSLGKQLVPIEHKGTSEVYGHFEKANDR